MSILLFVLFAVLLGAIGLKVRRPRFAERSMLELELYLRSIADPLVRCFNVGQNGAIVLVKIDMGSAGFAFLTGQTNATINDTTNQIDIGDKLSGRLGERTPGRATASVSVDLNFLRSDEVLVFLKTQYRNRRQVEIEIFDRDNLDTVDSAGAITGSDIESAIGIITNLTETHPDQDKSTITLEVSLNNDWVEATS